ncbi:MAG TPA: hypothetical protein VK463_02555, partial [Desulfomonilaceae bacterium]|nr:hypothetical protein [Desulfomonilaceae bacterium]
MRSSYLRIIVALTGILILGLMVVSHADNYLVIKKKGGPPQKIPLNFSPEEIESFQVESSPGAKAPAEVESPDAAQEPGARQPGAAPMILKKGPGTAQQPS